MFQAWRQARYIKAMAEAGDTRVPIQMYSNNISLAAGLQKSEANSITILHGPDRPEVTCYAPIDFGSVTAGLTYLSALRMLLISRHPDGKTDFNPDEAPGSIGVYLARGTWTTTLANFLKAAEKDGTADSDLALATEVFSFDDNRGTIMTDGILPSAYFSARRVVLGGTRNFRGIVGEVHEKNIGENKLAYCNLRVTFKIRNAGEGRGR